MDSGSTGAQPGEIPDPFPCKGLGKAVPALEEGLILPSTAAPEPLHTACQKAALILQEKSRSREVQAE